MAFEFIPLGVGVWRRDDPASAPPVLKEDGTPFTLRDAFDRINQGFAALDARATDEQLRDRAGHTGTQAPATIAGFNETVQDLVGAMLVPGAGATVAYDDAAGTVTIGASVGGGGTDAEIVRDVVAAALAGVGNITVTVNDAGDTITISTTATVNSTDAALRDRGTHTGTQSADTLTSGATNRVFTQAQETKLGGIATGATVNASDASLRDRTTHTNTQSADTLVNGTTNRVFTQAQETKLAGIAAAATANATDALLRDRGTHTGTQIAATISDFTEAAQDVVGALIAAAGGAYDDAAGTITLPAGGGGGSTLPFTTKTANHTLALVDAGTVVEVNSASALTVTIPNNTAVAFPADSWGEIMQLGAGSVTIALASGVTGRSSASLVLRGQNASARWRRRGANDFHISGDLA